MNALKNDPRTAWAFHEYESDEAHPPITELQASTILNALDDEEHVEVMLLGGLITRGEREKIKKLWARKLKLPTLPTSLTVTTMFRTLILSSGSSGVLSVENEREHGIPLASAQIVVCKLSPPREFIWFLRTGSRAQQILREGAGEYILRLPHQPGVPQMPQAADFLSNTSSSVKQESLSLLTGWRSVEGVAGQHLRELGIANVRLSRAGNDEGIDVLGDNIAAQVKMTALPVGRPVLQQLVGAARQYPYQACYSTSGYTNEAGAYADSNAISLFLVTERGQVRAYNRAAETFERITPISEEARVWRVSYHYVYEVRQRMNKWLKEELIDHLSERASYEKRLQFPEPLRNQYKNSIFYFIAAIKAAKNPPWFETGRDMIVYYYHAELLLALGVRAQQYDYSAPPELERRGAQISTRDFY